MSGVFYGIGVGPGDPELLTLKAIKILQEVDIILAPRTEKKTESSALAIVRPYIKEKTRIVHLEFPMVYGSSKLTKAWEDNKNIILEFLATGEKVAFLTLGDPMVYSTYIYIFRLLEGCGYPIETIPGITSFCQIASKTGMALAEGDEILTVLPATSEEDVVERVLKDTDNVVLMKVYKNLPQIIKALQKSGHIHNSVMVSKCGWEDEVLVRNLEDGNNLQDKVNYLTTIIAKRAGSRKLLDKDVKDVKDD